jgi:hypothetical protein
MSWEASFAAASVDAYRRQVRINEVDDGVSFRASLRKDDGSSRRAIVVCRSKLRTFKFSYSPDMRLRL